jgi:hypothetical protein
MPKSPNQAISFLETQWSGINQNKIKGIKSEIRLEQYLASDPIRTLYRSIIPGGWILAPGKNLIIDPVTKGRIAIIPICTAFSWSGSIKNQPMEALIKAESYFGQVGIETYFAEFDTKKDPQIEDSFIVPTPRNYITSYEMNFYRILHEREEVPELQVMRYFPPRNDNRGLKVRKSEIAADHSPWTDPALVTNLFWKEYVRYYLQKKYLISSNDMDFFIVGLSGKAYPIELKSKTASVDKSLGDWFGIDIGPFSKLSFFVSLSNNMEALYFVEEVDENGNTCEWWGVKFSELLKYCFWVPQSGGKSMGGTSSSTVKVPKVIFKKLSVLLSEL